MKKHNKKPLFTIIVPVYNAEKWIIKCVNSILKQSFNSYEIIIINDGSFDDSLLLCKKIENKDSRIKVYNRPHAGVVAARNFGIKHANGKYIVYVDADDWAKPNLLSAMYSVVVKFNEPDIVIHNFDKIFKGSIETSEFEFLRTKKENIKPGYYNKKDIWRYLFPNIFNIGDFDIGNWRAAFKKDLLLKHYCKDETIKLFEDYCYSYECIYYADSIYFLEDSLYCYNCLNNESVTSKNFDNYEEILRALNYIINNLYKKNRIINKQLINTFEHYLNQMCLSFLSKNLYKENLTKTISCLTKKIKYINSIYKWKFNIILNKNKLSKVKWPLAILFWKINFYRICMFWSYWQILWPSVLKSFWKKYNKIFH